MAVTSRSRGGPSERLLGGPKSGVGEPWVGGEGSTAWRAEKSSSGLGE